MKQMVPCITQYIIWCYAWDSRLTLTTLEKAHLIKTISGFNYSLDMVQQKCLVKICLQSLVIYQKGGVMRGRQYFPPKTSTVYWVTVNK